MYVDIKTIPCLRGKIKACLSRYSQNRDGSAAVEFAVIMPLFVSTFFGVLELANYSMVDRRAGFSVEYYAEVMAVATGRTLNRDLFQGESINSMVNPTSSPRYKDNPAFWARRSHEMAVASVDMIRIDPECEGSSCEFTPEVLWRYDRAYYLGRKLKPFGCELEVSSAPAEADADVINEAYVGRSPVIMTRIAYEYHPLVLPDLIFKRYHKKAATRAVRSSQPIQRAYRSGHCD